jgi:hypothetical protein
VVDYQVPAVMEVTNATPAPRVIVGTPQTAGISVRNAANVPVAVAADELNYTLVGSGATSGTFAGTRNALAPAATVNLPLDTATVGSKTATVTVNATSQQAENGSVVRNLNYQVVGASVPSLNSGTVQTTRTVDFGVVGLGDAPVGLSQVLSVFNVGSTQQAGLDIDSLAGTGRTSGFAAGFTPVTGIAAGAGSAAITLNPSTAASGSFSATYTLGTSDENIPGAATRASLSIQALVRVTLAGDATVDGVVDINDFAVLVSNFNTLNQTWTGSDFTYDQSVDIADFARLVGNFNQTTPFPTGVAGTLIPEPAGLALIVPAVALMRRRRRR